MKTKFYIIAGEASGDLHGSNLIKALKRYHPESTFRCWGGDLMEREGGKIVKHYKQLAFMGFLEVIANIRTILKNIKFCKQDILSYKPNVLILIDYPGFNLRIAKFAYEHNIKVHYYISPQIWAWKQSRVYKIKKYVDKMYVILPFEKDFYKKFDYDVEFVGHPLLDAIETFKNKTKNDDFLVSNKLDNRPIIAILPGSRKQEISKMLSTMLLLVDKYKNYQFVIAGTSSNEDSFYTSFTHGKIPVIKNKTYNLLFHAKAALVTSGTATLETALFEVPQVVCYKGGYISYLIARSLIKVKYISLVNLIADKEIVKELIQNEFNQSNLKAELDKILTQSDTSDRIKLEYRNLNEKLGGAGASERTAQLLLKTL